MAFVGVYRAVYDYKPQSDEELEIKAGDLLFVLEKSTDDDWWKCKKKAATDDDDEPEGLVPNNYVEEAKPTYHTKALYDYASQSDEELRFKEDTRLNVYDDSDPDWTLVGHNGEFGFAPAIYIESVSTGAGATASTAAANVPLAATQRRELAPPPMPTAARPVVEDDGPIPGEADYVPKRDTYSSGSAAGNPAAALAGIIAQKTGGGQIAPTASRDVASPTLPPRPQFTPEESDEDIPPPKPRRPDSQALPTSSPTTQYATSRPDPAGVLPSPPYNRAVHRNVPAEDDDEVPRSPGGFRLYNIHEIVSHMGKNKKMPSTLGINLAKGAITISPEKSRDGPSKEWTADKLTHYSIEGKHVFIELVRPSKSVDFHAGAKDTAREIVALLGELAGAARAEGLREVIAASHGTGSAGKKKGHMLYEFAASSADEVTVIAGEDVIILDDHTSEDWWKVRRVRDGNEGVVPSTYVEVTGTVDSGPEAVTGLNAARSTVEQNRLEEERLAKEAVRRDKSRNGDAVPERYSSLGGDGDRRGSTKDSNDRKAKEQPKTKPNSSRVRTWTDRSGTFKVEAEFIGLREGKIHLHKLNGVKIAVPVVKMAVEDLEYVERVTGTSLDEDKPLSDIKRRSTILASSNGGKATTAGATIEPPQTYDWFDFFLQCGVNPQICERYAAAFHRDQMSPEILPEVNEQLLRTLGLKEGDILRVTKYLDNKYDRKKTNGDDNGANGSSGGLFSGPGGALKNNTRKGRPAPAVQTNDVVDESAFRHKAEASPSTTKPVSGEAQATPLTSAPVRQPTSGFDDDAWDVKPSKTPTSATPAPDAPKPIAAPPAPKINDDIAALAISAPALQPAVAAPPSVTAPPLNVPAVEPAQPSRPQGADQAIFDKIASLAPQPPRQRPTAPAMTQQVGSTISIPPPPRAASAPGFNPQQPSAFTAPTLQPQLTGYQPQFAPQTYGQPNMQQMPQQTGLQSNQIYSQFQPTNGLMPQPTGLQSLQQNFPAMAPQPTGFQPHGQYGPPQTSGFIPSQPTGFGYGQPNYQQPPPLPTQLNGAPTGSPFADPPRQPFQPLPSGLSNSYAPNQGGFQPSFSIAQPTGFGAQPTLPNPPQLPPQQTGGVFGPSQPLGSSVPMAPLTPQKTGPAPPVRFGVTPGAKPLMPQPTGRANLAKATPQNPFGF